MVQREYGSSRSTSGMTFYPLAFHPAYGNFTSPGPPRFLQDHVFAVMKDNMSFQNDGADVLSCDYFQAYSNIKRSIRYNLEDLLVTEGVATRRLRCPSWSPRDPRAYGRYSKVSSANASLRHAR